MSRRRQAIVRARLFARGVAYRRGIAALIFVGAVAAAAAAAVAPNYRDAAAISALRSRMTAASASASGVEVVGTSWPGNSPDVRLAKEVPHFPFATAFIPSISVGGSTTQLQAGNGPVEFASLEWRASDCLHVVFRSGHCPRRPDEVALSTSSSQVLHAPVGRRILASHLDQPDFGLPRDIDNRAVPARYRRVPTTPPLQDRVSGVFDVPPSQLTYWFGQNPATPILDQGGSQAASVIALVPRATLVGLSLPYRARVAIDQPIDWSHLALPDAQRIDAAVTALRARTPRYRAVDTRIPSLLRAAAIDRGELSQLIRLAQIQLLLLVGLVLIAILAASMDRRRAELVIATLQGRRPVVTALALSAEPVLLVLLGLVPGLLISLPLAKLGSRLWLAPGTPTHLAGSAVATALVVAAVAATAAVAIAHVAASRPGSEQLAEDLRAAGGRAGGWIDLVALTLAVAGLVELLATHTGAASTPWSLLAPSLCGLAAGLALGRLIPALLRPAVRATAQTRKLGRFLAIRELRRDRAAWRVTAVVALALSLLSFAVSISRGAASDRSDRAGLILGAPTVAIVTVAPNRSLIAAVDQADPSGRWAMAAKEIDPFGSASIRNLAVDSPRLPAVAGWTRTIGGYTPRGLAGILHVSAAAARRRVPVIAAGGVGSTTYGLDNEPLPRLELYQAQVIPELLGEGSLTDLSTLQAATPQAPPFALGTTQIVDKVWLGPHAPPDAFSLLRSAGISVISVDRGRTVVTALDRRAQTNGLSGFLAVAVIAAVLAIALLLGTSVAAATRQRSETLALTAAGVRRSTVVIGRVGAASSRLVLAGMTALACGLVTAHLASRLVPQASPGELPRPLLPLPVLPAVIAVAVTIVPAIVLEAVIASYAAKRADAASLRNASA